MNCSQDKSAQDQDKDEIPLKQDHGRVRLSQYQNQGMVGEEIAGNTGKSPVWSYTADFNPTAKSVFVSQQ